MRPIALQDNLAKTQAAERMNQIQKAHGEMEQRLTADALKEKTTADMEKTRESEKADMVIIRKEQEKEKQQKQKQKNNKKDPDDQENGKPEHLDLTA
jgi:hypothetical protein